MAAMSNNELTVTTDLTTPCSSVVTGSTGISFNAIATISNICNLSATPLNFGSIGVLQVNVDIGTTVQANCTNTTPYIIALDQGTGVGATTTTRKMTAGAITIDYSLYKNAARTLVWGNIAGTDTLAGTGSGFDQLYTVYGRVPPQPTPAPGTYSDTIVVTLTY
jgi:spore coat protein U-like protein